MQSKMCNDHWLKLKKALEDAGLDKLCSHDKKEMTAKMESSDPKVKFDPLLLAYMEITTHALMMCGPGLMLSMDGKQNCPLCYSKATCNCGEPEACSARIEQWISDAVKYIREDAQKMGLVVNA